MSISIGKRNLTTVCSYAPYTPAPSAAMEAAAPLEAAFPLEAGELKCSPWEGLYLEQGRPFAVNDNRAAQGQRLDDFLASLMYGE